MTTKNTAKTIADFTAELATAKQSPVAELATLEAFQADCEKRVAQPIGSEAAAHIRARLELSEVKQALGEFYTWRLESRQQAAAEAYLEAAAPAICEALRADIETRSKSQPGFIAKQMETAAQITKRIFTTKENRHAIYKERELAEQAAEDAEATLAAAITQVRQFELMPTEQAFHAAAARVAEITTFP
jgi:hypothetical protein